MAEDRDWTTASAEELPELIDQRWKRYFVHIEQTGRGELWRRSTRAWNGLDPSAGPGTSHGIEFGGEQGEVVLLRENHYRSIGTHMLVLTTADRPGFQAMPLSGDFDAMDQAELAQGLVDYFMGQKDLEDRSQEVAEWDTYLGEGWLALTWDPAAGEQVGTDSIEDDNGEIRQIAVHEGDMVAEAFHPASVLRDPHQNIRAQRWIVLRRRVNRWDLIAQYPDLEDDIRNVRTVTEADADFITSAGRAVVALHETDCDYVYVSELYRERTPNLSEGRHAQCVGNVTLFDGPLPYPKIPAYVMCSAQSREPGFGYAQLWDLLGLQEAADSTISTVMTNLDAFGVQNIITPRGANLTPDMIADGLRALEYSPQHGKPEVLDLLQIKEAPFKILEHILRAMETISGINEVARGNPPREMSGTAMALVQAMAIKFNSRMQRAYGRLLEQVGNGALDLVKAFATTPRIAEIAGPDSGGQLVSFTKDSVSKVHRVSIELGAPIMRTAAGRKEIADQLVDMYKGTPEQVSKEQYIAFITTGRLEPITQAPRRKRLHIRRENEQLRKQRPVKVLLTDNHADHINEHASELCDPVVRFDDNVAGPILEHLQEHIDTWRAMSQTNPGLLAATGQQPFPEPPPPPPPPGPPGPPPPGMGPGGPPPGPPGAPPEGPGPRAQVPGAPPQVEGVPLPQLPQNPLNGEAVGA